ncbi:MAG: thioredoxin family protein [Chitinophagaceae bacterium]|nr:thioredoxin family protein [Chitinophagaceae bacterium]
MKSLFGKKSFFLFLFSLPLYALLYSQSNQNEPLWVVESKKKGEGYYELQFLCSDAKGWEIYTPEQSPGGVPAVSIAFEDSLVHAEMPIRINGQIKKIKNTALDTLLNVFDGPADFTISVRIKGIVPERLTGSLFYTYGKNDEYIPSAEYAFSVPLEGGVSGGWQPRVSSLDISRPLKNCGDDEAVNKGLLTVFLLGILGGFIALLTPCVFPMIPVTVTFFTKKSTDRKKGIRNAVLYGFFIFLIYTLITVPFHFVESTRSEIFNNISTNAWVNLVFFVIFVVFALSFFGLFELTLPSSLANLAGARSGIADLGGIFFMALTLVIVSFSCTGPILGTLLVGQLREGPWPLTFGAAGFGLALSLPFALFAMFPRWMQSLPRSGSWMQTLKVVLGFVELGLAVKFFANADNVKQWGIMKREIFIGAWIIISLLTTLYLFGFFEKKNEKVIRRLSFMSVFFGILFGAFTIYLIPGLFNSKSAKLKWLSGFPPPFSYSIYPHHVLHAKGVNPIMNDLDAAMEKAKKENKPVLIDFTGWACVNCRRMEEKVWTDYEADSLMRTQFVVVSLYVDERRLLPPHERITYTNSSGKEERILTVGDKWTAFQKENFGAVSQPQYAIITPDFRALTKTKFYTPDAGEFTRWLTCGLEAYRAMK